MEGFELWKQEIWKLYNKFRKNTYVWGVVTQPTCCLGGSKLETKNWLLWNLDFEFWMSGLEHTVALSFLILFLGSNHSPTLSCDFQIPTASLQFFGWPVVAHYYPTNLHLFISWSLSTSAQMQPPEAKHWHVNTLKLSSEWTKDSHTTCMSQYFEGDGSHWVIFYPITCTSINLSHAQKKMVFITLKLKQQSQVKIWTQKSRDWTSCSYFILVLFPHYYWCLLSFVQSANVLIIHSITYKLLFHE